MTLRSQNEHEKIPCALAPSAKPTPARLKWLLLLTLWLAYGFAINSGNLNAFALQHAGVEAYVERHTLYLEGSSHQRLQVQPVVDAFLYEGHIYPAKQPGQFMAGAVAYFPLHALGLSYARDYLLTAALVTFLTASLATAAGALAVYGVAREFLPAGSKLFWPLLCALSYGLGTTAFAYSGIAWHDSLATGYLAVAFYLLVRLSRGDERGRSMAARAAAAGGLLGLTITTSMLPSFMAAVVALYFFSLRRRELLIWFVLGGLVGLAPLLVYNAVCFGNPVLLPNVAGNYSDTYFRPSWGNFLSKLEFYARMLTLYAPVFWAGLAGLLLLPSRLRREQATLLVMLFALAAYILNIEANGTCQYGPRYLLPAMPFACVGLTGFGLLRGAGIRKVLAASVSACALVSFLINLVGAMHGAMLCDFPHSALGMYLSEMWNGGMRSYPLARWLALPLCLCVALLAHSLATRKPPADSSLV
ncbi:MAG TPA: hypothetical protein VEX60_03060 [Pyrinomonadaceae bacterium]|nr:hypothetical protein [Pyrinomonadaceae bacterium]